MPTAPGQHAHIFLHKQHHQLEGTIQEKLPG